MFFGCKNFHNKLLVNSPKSTGLAASVYVKQFHH
jgi:hypothetical protein